MSLQVRKLRRAVLLSPYVRAWTLCESGVWCPFDASLHYHDGPHINETLAVAVVR